MFTTIHFTDLKEHAHRGQIERGMRYLRCHDLRGVEDSSNQALAYEFIAYSNAGNHVYEGEKMTYPVVLHPGYHRTQIYFAADMGLWDVPGIHYKNKWNYVLDIAELRRQNILIDTTVIKGPHGVRRLFGDY